MTLPAYTLKNGTLLNEIYRITSFIGNGVFGFTYKAEHLHLPLEYVIKEFFINGKCSRHGSTQAVEIPNLGLDDFQHYKNRFSEEATILAQLKGQAQIVALTDYFEENNTAYIVMPFLEGEDLERYVEKQPNKRLPQQEALGYIEQICTALQVVHAQNILHRDLKPTNLLRTHKGKIYLLDFGSAEIFTEGIEQTLEIIIAPSYAPPEQYHHRTVRYVGSDVYAVGATLYRLLVGQQPLDAIQRVMGTPLLAPHVMDSTISLGVSKTIMKALAVFPHNRYQTIAAFWQDLSLSFSEKREQYVILQNLSDNMVFIEGGIFMMGEGGFAADFHEVFLSPFYINKYPITQAEWQAVMGSNPSRFKGDKLPVEQVSWHDVQVFIVKLNQKTGKKYCLPSDAQWVFAAKGGENFKYAGSDNPDEVAWYADNSGDKKLLDYWDWAKIEANHCQTHPVGQKKANGYGLYDMSGNVCEWCQDVYNSDYYAQCKRQGLVENPMYTGSGTQQVFRGGSWRLPAIYAAVLPRFEMPPVNRYDHLGFRLCQMV